MEACAWLGLYAFQSHQMSHDQLPFEGTVRHCDAFSVWRNVRFGGLWLAFVNLFYWRFQASKWTFQSQQMSHDQLPFEGTVRPSLPCGVAGLWHLFSKPFKASKWATTSCPSKARSVTAICCFGVAKRTFWMLVPGLWNLFYERFKASKWATTSCPSKARSVTAMLLKFRYCGETYVLDACAWPLKLAGGWPLQLVLQAVQSEQMSHDQLTFEGTIRPSLPCCFRVAERMFWRLVAGLCSIPAERAFWRLAASLWSLAAGSYRVWFYICVSKRANEPRPAALRRHI